ncbi:ABATE domain-containing protein [Nonomuraea sp. NPDC046570]|uniref:CGNR zinc finger domain-containing protein n=1 Tax=Nonomuraea sp. NPDC046570 TaxID=3155255 RepID=UPI0033CDFB2A
MDDASGVLLTGRDGQAFRFDAGTLCLEFLLSGAVPEWEQLHSPQDLADWIPLTRLGVTGRITVTETELTSAKRLRAAIQQLAESGATADLAALNEMASAPPPAPVIGADRKRGWAYPVTGAQFLSAVARDAIELFSGPRAGRVRMCAGERCALLFLDTSRPGARRWCSMDRCGNRQKLRTRRDRTNRA